jgi:hypothetical protein
MRTFAALAAPILASGLALAAIPAHAAPSPPFKAHWTVVEAGTGGAMAYDAASLERDDKSGQAYLTMMIGLAKPGAFDGRPVEFLIVDTGFDCKTPQWRRGTKIGIGPDLKPLGHDDTVEAWRPIAPETYAAGVRAFACKGIAPGKPVFEGSYIDTVLFMRKQVRPQG